MLCFMLGLVLTVPQASCPCRAHGRMISPLRLHRSNVGVPHTCVRDATRGPAPRVTVARRMVPPVIALAPHALEAREEVESANVDGNSMVSVKR
jgi:hypothetical protein